MRLFPTILILFSAAATLAMEPFRVDVGRGRNWRAVKFANESSTLMDKGDLRGARQSIDAAIRADPTMWPAYFKRAQLLLLDRKYEESIRDCGEVLRHDSTFAPAALLRAEANSDLGNYSASLSELNHLISIRPRLQYFAIAYWERARLYAGCPDPALRNGTQAVKDAMLGCKMTFWKDATAIDVLACAHAELGDFDSAIRYIREAIATESTSVLARKRMQKHLALFEKHQPYRINQLKFSEYRG